MTDGRFEAVNSVRPNNWDQRLLWCERPDFIHLDPEIRYDESCPFHDLKASGCFEPDYGLIHDYDRVLTPGGNVKRPDGNRLKLGGKTRYPMAGVGGRLLPLDTIPLPIAGPLKPHKMAFGNPGKYFSTPGYMAAPEKKEPAEPLAPLAPVGPFSNKIKLGGPIPYMPDGRGKAAGPLNFALKAGTYHPRQLPPVLKPLKQKAEIPPKLQSPIYREPYKAKYYNGFGPEAPHLPTPYTDGPLEKRVGGPIFTYWAHSKRTVPIQCPWSTLVQTADPIKGYKTLTDGSRISPIQTRGTM